VHSQVGHNALGAGQIIDQGARLVDNAISSGSMWTHEDGWMYIKPVRPDQPLGLWPGGRYRGICMDASDLHGAGPSVCHVDAERTNSGSRDNDNLLILETGLAPAV